jgi:hypothetical protein
MVHPSPAEPFQPVTQLGQCCGLRATVVYLAKIHLVFAGEKVSGSELHFLNKVPSSLLARSYQTGPELWNRGDLQVLYAISDWGNFQTRGSE